MMISVNFKISQGCQLNLTLQTYVSTSAAGPPPKIDKQKKNQVKNPHSQITGRHKVTSIKKFRHHVLPAKKKPLCLQVRIL